MRQGAMSDLSYSSGSFGKAILAHRKRLGLSQAAIYYAAEVASSVCSQIETGRRPAPPPATAKCIARALKLPAEQVQTLVALAEAERVVATHDAHLAPETRQLLFEIRSVAPRLSREMVASLRVRLQEVSR